MTEPIDYQALCKDLVEDLSLWMEYGGNPANLPFEESCTYKLLKRARKALAQPEPDVAGPSDEEIMGLMPQQMHDDLAAAVRAMAVQEGIDSTPAKGAMRIMLNRHVVDLARAVLARWGRPAPVPAEGEVAELVEFLRVYGDEVMDEYGDVGEHDMLTRAADLLEQYQAAPVPAEAEVEKAPAVTEVIAWLRTEAEIDDGFELTQSAAYQRRAADLLEQYQAAPVPAEGEVGPSEEEWNEFVDRLWDKYDCAGVPFEWSDFRQALNDARAVLARWDRPAPVPAGEVGELVAWLRLTADEQPHTSGQGCIRLTRAADLLEHQAAPAPVSVSERLPGPEDCDANDNCWWFDPDGDGAWYMDTPYTPFQHWLPATALPLPSGEVQP